MELKEVKETKESIEDNNTNQRLKVEMEYFKIRVRNTMSFNKISAILEEILNSKHIQEMQGENSTDRAKKGWKAKKGEVPFQ